MLVLLVVMVLHRVPQFGVQPTLRIADYFLARSGLRKGGEMRDGFVSIRELASLER